MDLFKTAKTKNSRINTKAFTVYKGTLDGRLVYVGTTVQKPADRFRWHKANGKKFDFEVLEQFDNENDMLDLEFSLIKKHNPKFNKIKHRKQNLNRKLSQTDLDARVGDPRWCQCCLKRRVNKGYVKCYYC